MINMWIGFFAALIIQFVAFKLTNSPWLFLLFVSTIGAAFIVVYANLIGFLMDDFKKWWKTDV